MKAAVYRATGSPDVLRIEDIPAPQPASGEVLVRIHASGVNPSDTKTRSGMFPLGDGWERMVPHNDGAGLIEDVGAGVSASRVGERVWLHTTQWGGFNGTAAAYAVARADRAIRLPDDVSFAAGATFGVPLLTAWQSVMMNGAVDGRTVLVQGGAGAVGNYAIQIARAKGARVITTVSAPAKAAAARGAGADEVIDYRRENVTARVLEATKGRGVDHLIEVNLSVNGPKLDAWVKPGGFIAVYGSDDPMAEIPAISAIVRQLRFGFFLVYELAPDVLAAATRDLTELLASGRLQPYIDEVFPLERVADAHRRVEEGAALGNVVVSVA
ncbi:MAG: NADPH:quinone reductase [Myxococcota bacterium]